MEMLKNYEIMRMSPVDITMDFYLYDEFGSDKNSKTIQRMWTIAPTKHIELTIVTEEEIDTFLQLLDEDVVIQEFLRNDSCSQLADKYLLAMVFTYFKRADYLPQDYTRYNFFVALFLAHDMEEDDEDIKFELYIWALGFNWQQHFKQMMTSREILWKAMDHRGIVSRACCESVMAIKPNHPVWQRTRAEVHAGAIRPYSGSSTAVCCNCKKVKSTVKADSGISNSGDDSDSPNADYFKADSSQPSLEAYEMFTNEMMLMASG